MISKRNGYKVAKKIVRLPKIGEALLFISKIKGGQTRYFVTNDLKMIEKDAIKLYDKRFDKEIFHKEIDNILDLEKYMCILGMLSKNTGAL